MDSFHASNPKFDFIQVYFKWTRLQEQPHTHEELRQIIKTFVLSQLKHE